MQPTFIPDAHHLVDDAATELVALEAVLDQGDLIEAQHHLSAALRLLETALRHMRPGRAVS